MRVTVPAGLCVAIALQGCGSSSTAPAAHPSDAALGRTANAVLDAARDRDVGRFCALLPSPVVRGIGGSAKCPAFAADELPRAGSGDAFNLLGPRPGPVRQIVDVTNSKALDRLFDARGGAWIVLVGGGRRRALNTPEWRAMFEQMSAAARRETLQIARDRVQCVAVVREAKGLRGMWDKACVLYLQRKAP